MTHVREEFCLEFAGMPKLFGALVKFGVERDNAAIGVAQLLIELLAFFVLAPDLFQALHQLSILLTQRLERICGAAFLQRRRYFGELRSRDGSGTGRQVMADFDDRSLASLGLDREMMHQAAGADDTEAHAALGAILPVEDRLDIGDARSLVGDPDVEDLRRGRWIENELGTSSVRITVGVSRQLRNSGCDPGLVLSFKSQQLGQPMGALAHGDDVRLVLDRDGHDGPNFCICRHERHHFATRTVASSRCRVRSRYSTAAINVGCRAARLGYRSKVQLEAIPSEWRMTSPAVNGYSKA